MDEFLTDDAFRAAVRVDLWIHNNVPTPPEVVKAISAQQDLLAKRAADGYRDPNRDERRLDARYDRIIAGHREKAIGLYRLHLADRSSSQI